MYIQIQKLSYCGNVNAVIRRKILWECEEGHQWKARPANIKSGKWCPECGKKKMWETRRRNQELRVNELAS